MTRRELTQAFFAEVKVLRSHRDALGKQYLSLKDRLSSSIGFVDEPLKVHESGEGGIAELEEDIEEIKKGIQRCQAALSSPAYHNQALIEISRAAAPQGQSVAATALLALSEAAPEEIGLLQSYQAAKSDGVLGDFFREQDHDVLLLLTRKLRARGGSVSDVAKQMLFDLARFQESQNV